MRFELAGSLVRPEPIVIRFNVDAPPIPHVDFDTQHYRDLGYTHFEVICIGGGGGMGGGINTQNTGTKIRSFGGAGGGGGFHSVHGLLSALPSTCPVVVGAGGTLGSDHISDPNLTTDGGNGGYSSFNDTTCQASGGRGGKHVQTNLDNTSTQASGGVGGVGNRTSSGGGAAGGTAGIPTPTGVGSTAGQNGKDGTLFQNVGEGGGGGAGGVGKYGTVTCCAATLGGRGAYNPGDTSVYGPGSPLNGDPSSGSQNVVPGGAGGAKAAPVNGLPTVYGQSRNQRLPGDPGTVIIRLTAK